MKLISVPWGIKNEIVKIYYSVLQIKS